jgi:hypothetical protein
MIDIGKKELYTFCEMFENTVFIAFAFKFAKSANRTQKSFGATKSIRVSKNAECCANFKFVSAGFQKC